MKRSNFERSALAGCVVNQDMTAIEPTRALYRLAFRRDVKVFLITGRPEGIRDLTEEHLDREGFAKRHTLYMAEESNDSAADEKTAARKRIVRRGFRIIANLGDQESDLAGGFAQRRYKLPNPMYFTP